MEEGSGNVVADKPALTGFTAVDLQNALEADVTRADPCSVIIRVDDSFLGLLDVSKVGDKSRVRLEPGISLRGDVTPEVAITMPDLQSLRLSRASRANVSGFRLSDELDVGLSGASRVDGDLEAGEVDIEASGASNLDLADFVVDSADIELSGASQATVNVEERIDSLDVSGAFRLRYRGNPSLGNVDTSGGGTVDKIDSGSDGPCGQPQHASAQDGRNETTAR